MERGGGEKEEEKKGSNRGRKGGGHQAVDGVWMAWELVTVQPVLTPGGEGVKYG